MTTSTERVVCYKDVTRLHIRDIFDELFDALAHGTQMYWNMRCIDNKITLRVKDSATEVEPLLYIGR